MPKKTVPVFVSTLVSEGQARIVWSDEVRAQLLPDRSNPPAMELEREALYAEVAAKVKAYWKENTAYFTKDKKSDRTKEWMAAYEKLVERFESTKLVLPLDLDQEAAHWAVAHDEGLLVRYWLATMDPEFALRAFVRAWRWDPWGH